MYTQINNSRILKIHIESETCIVIQFNTNGNFSEYKKLKGNISPDFRETSKIVRDLKQ